MEYEKSYTGLLIWFAAFTVVTTLIGHFPVDEALKGLIFGNAVFIFIVIFTWMVHRNGRIYWYPGITCEQSAEAGYEKRHEYAKKHFQCAGIFAILYLGYSFIAFFAGVPSRISLVVFCIGYLAVLVRMKRMKL